MGKPTIQELKAIKKEALRKEEEESAEKERFNTAVELGLCPECGSKLHRETDFREELKKPRKRFFGVLPTKTHETWDVGIYCPESKEHYLRRYNYDTYAMY